jgi:hypothetical protein
MNGRKGPEAVGLLSGDRPEEAVDQRARVEWQGSTQLRRSKIDFQFSKAVIHEVGAPTSERPKYAVRSIIAYAPRGTFASDA